jgi:hypothetical protein
MLCRLNVVDPVPTCPTSLDLTADFDDQAARRDESAPDDEQAQEFRPSLVFFRMMGVASPAPVGLTGMSSCAERLI